MTEARGAAEEAVGAPLPPLPAKAARSAALLLATEVIGKVSTFGFTVVAARVLSRADFGAFTYGLAFALLVTVVPAWGFSPVVVRDGSRSPSQLAVYYSEALAWRALLLVPTFAVAVVVGVLTRPTTKAWVALVLLLFAAGCDLFADTAKQAAAVRGELRGWALALIVNRVVSAVVGVGLLALGFGVVGLSAGFLVGSLVGAVGAGFAVRGLGVRFSRSLLTWPGWTAMGRQSVALGVDALVAMALSRVDMLILGGLKGDAAVAVYGAAYRLLDTVLFVTWTLNTVVFPRTSAVPSGAEREVRRLTESALGAVASLFVPFGVVLLVRGPEVLGLVFGRTYEVSGADTVRWLSMAPLAFAVSFFASAALLSRRRNAAVLGASAMAAGVNVGLNFVLIPKWGPSGAALVTTASYLLEAVVLVVLCRRLAGDFGWLRLDRALALPVVAAVPLAAVLLAGSVPIVVQLAVGGALYAAAWWSLAQRFAPESFDLLKAAATRRRPSKAV
jgi:O-antigen/teichoic acid export membrane protein